MGFKMGIVGLPNVGKSTLFNALTRTAAAQAANFPFCTIEPNVGEVAVPDARLDILAEIAGSKQIIPARMTFVDIAGLVKGASKGEGLGNQFLANIRETDAIAHVLRCFEDGDITHVDGRVDPVADAEVIETELMLADMESIEKRLVNIVRKVRGGDKEAIAQERLMKAAMIALEDGKPARVVDVDEDDAKIWKNLGLLTTKPILYVCNVDEASSASGNAFSEKVAAMAAEQGAA
jgi:GTP-binding protein YchF